MQVLAGVGDHDDRYYVTDEMWATEPYKNFVYLEIMWTEDIPLANCSAQYVAPNLILSAGHCTEPDHEYRATNYKHETFPIKLVETGYKGKEVDWAVWLVTDPKYYSDTFFYPNPPQGTENVINAGWGWVRILSDTELDKIRKILSDRSFITKIKQNSSSEDVYEFINTKLLEGEDVGYADDMDCRNKRSDGCWGDGQYDQDCLNQVFKQCRVLFDKLTDHDNRLKASRCKILPDRHIIHGSKILGTTCDSWTGNSGGGYISLNDNDLYGISSYGVTGAGSFYGNRDTDYMASSLQFSSQVYRLKGTYDWYSNSPEENIAKIPKNLNVNNSENKMLRMNRHIQNLSSEKAELNTNVMKKLQNIDVSSDDDILDFLDILVTYKVKAERLAELEKAYQNVRENEQSWANKALTAATVAATGLGGMEWARGAAEQWADEAAETEMADYLAGMRCEYGNGNTVNLGDETNLPGGNELGNYYAEYKQIANRLKETKAALNLRPGIESEVLYERAQTGLYQYQTAEIQSGGEPSLSRALVNPDGDDATTWKAQKTESSEKAESGKKWGIGGAVGGAIGNIGINTDLIKNISGKNGN